MPKDAYVEAHGGQLWSEPHPTGGTPDETRFTFRISLAHKSAVTKSDRANRLQAAGSPRSSADARARS